MGATQVFMCLPSCTLSYTTATLRTMNGQIFGVVLHKMYYQITFSSGEANKKFTKVNLSIKVDLYNFHYINPCMHLTERVKTSTKTV